MQISGGVGESNVLFLVNTAIHNQPIRPVYRITKRPIWRALCKKNVAMALCALTIP